MAPSSHKGFQGPVGSKTALVLVACAASASVRGVVAEELGGSARKLIRTEGAAGVPPLSDVIDSTGRFRPQLPGEHSAEIKVHTSDSLLTENLTAAAVLHEATEEALRGTTVLLAPPSLASMSGRWWQNNVTNENTGSLSDNFSFALPKEFVQNQSRPDWEGFPEYAFKASQYDDLFSNFRQTFSKRMYANIDDPRYDERYVKELVKMMKETSMKSVDERIRRVNLMVDSIGNATVYPVADWTPKQQKDHPDWLPPPNISGATARYLKYAYDMEQLFGDLGGFNIVEIGGGWGGQAAVLLSLFPNISSYTLVDLPEALHLSSRYVKAATKEQNESLPDQRQWKLKFVKGEPGFIPEKQYDLIISSSAYSEVPLPLRGEYFDKLLKRSARGFIVDNSFTTKKNFGEFTSGALPLQLLMAGVVSGDSFLVLPTAFPNPNDDGANIVAWNVTSDYFGPIVNRVRNEPELFKDYPVRKLRRDCNMKFQGRDMTVCDEKVRLAKEKKLEQMRQQKRR